MGMMRVVCVLFALVAVTVSLRPRGPKAGGWSEQDVNNPRLTDLLEEVYYPQSIGAENLNLIKVETQVVAGINYKFTFTVGKTNSQCHAIIWHQAWTGTK